MGGYELSRAQGFRPGVALGRALLSTPLPPDPPPTPPSSCTRFPDIPEDIGKTGAGRRRRGEGLGAQHCAGLGWGRVSSAASTPRAWEKPRAEAYWRKKP